MKLFKFGLLAPLIGAFFLATIPAMAQQPPGALSRSQLQTNAATDFANNTQGLITAAVLQNYQNQVSNSAVLWQNDVGVSGSTVCLLNANCSISGAWSVAGSMAFPGIVNGHYVSVNASHEIVDGGTACCTSGTVASATAGQLAYYAATGAAVAGTSVLTINGTNVSNTGAYQISTVNVLSANFANSLNPSFFVGNGGNNTLTGAGNYGFTNGLTNLTGGGSNSCFGQNTCVAAVNLSLATAMGNGALQNAADTATYSIGIGAGAGANLAGSESIAIGHASMPGATGTLNIAAGTNSCAGIVAGSDNLCLGYNTLATTQVGALDSNVAIADFTLQHLTTGSGNVAINAFSSMTSGSNNVGIRCCAQFSSGSNNLLAGAGAFFFGAGSQNVVLGAIAGPGISGSLGMSNSVLVGYDAGQNITSSSSTTNIVALGAGSCNDVTTATGSICIGTGVSAGSATQNSLLNIGNIIKGDMATNILTFPGFYIETPATVASTACTTALKGAHRMASDLSGATYTYGAAAVGSGTRVGPIFCTGSSWLEGKLEAPANDNAAMKRAA